MKALVVDDNADNRYLLEVLLKSRGHEVVSAANGVEAIERLRHDPVDLIISDILMPKMDGYRLCRACKQDEGLRDIPFLFVTATYTDEKDEAFARSLGAEGFVRRPIEPDGLVDIAEHVVAEHHDGVTLGMKNEDESGYLAEYADRVVNKLEDKVVELQSEIEARKQAEHAVREREERLRLIAETIEDVFWISTPGVKEVLYISPAYERFWERTCESLYSAPQSFLDAVHPDDRPKLTLIMELHAQGKPYEVEYRIVQRSGATRWMRERGFPIRDAEGKLRAMTGVVSDITERKQAEKQSQERMKELQALYHLSAMAERKDFALESLCQELANALPESWQYPEIACARIVVGESEFFTANFGVSEWMQAAPIKVLGSVVGKIEIGYLERKPEEDEGPFLKEERQLIDAIAERLGQITELKHAEAELRASEELFRALADATSEGILIHEHGRIVEANRQMEAILGRPRAEIVGAAILDFVTPAWRDMINRRIQTPADTRVEYAFLRPDGSEALVSGLAHSCVHLGRPMRVAAFRDITSEKRAEEALRNVNAYNRSLIEVSLDPLVTISPDGKITDVNQATVRATGVSREALLGSDFSDYFTEPDKARAGYQEAFAKGLVTDYPLALRHASGSIMKVLYNASVYRNAKGEVAGVFAAARDITARKRAEEKLLQLAHYDLLTGLPNRNLLSDRLRQAIAAAKRDKAHLAVMFLDLDSFKPINDTFGHDVGDLLLKEVAKRLSDCVRESDTVSRVGGDEFVLLLPTVVEHDARQVAEKMLHAVTQPFDLRGNTLHVSSSIGIAMYPNHGSEEKLLIKNADTAMYRAKQSGRNNFQFFTDEMNIHASERLALENGLRRALREREFFLVYQPLMALGSSRIVGVEALLRWRHPERGVILPEEFIPLAEESGLILPIGEWVLQTACRQLREWSQNAIPTFRIGINLSARQFRQRDLPGMVRRVMEENRVSPSNLEIELTESTLIEDAEWAAEALQQLKDMGIRLSIDDFGTGYSSLRYLQLFPIDNLKIDAHFTCDLATNANDQAIATAIIAMGHSMQMSVVAEGVETLQQLEFLRDRGCDVIQGYYVDEPLSPEKAAAALAVAGHA